MATSIIEKWHFVSVRVEMHNYGIVGVGNPGFHLERTENVKIQNVSSCSNFYVLLR